MKYGRIERGHSRIVIVQESVHATSQTTELIGQRRIARGLMLHLLTLWALELAQDIVEHLVRFHGVSSMAQNR